MMLAQPLKTDNLTKRRKELIVVFSVVTVTATGTATAVFICHRTSAATEEEIGASDCVAGQCIIFITRVVNG